MTAFVAKYRVVELVPPPYPKDINLTTYIDVGGKQIASSFGSFAGSGINRCELVGLVPESSISFSEHFKNSSWDPVGTIFYSLKTLELDEKDIPPEYRAVSERLTQKSRNVVRRLLDEQRHGPTAVAMAG